MGRGSDDLITTSRGSLDDLERDFQENVDPDLPSYVEKIEYRPGFLVSFAHEAKDNPFYESPRFDKETLKRPSLLVSFHVDREKFAAYDETFDLEEDENLEQRIALYLSNRLLPLAEHSARGRVIEGYALEDQDALESKVPLQKIELQQEKIVYSLALS